MAELIIGRVAIVMVMFFVAREVRDCIHNYRFHKEIDRINRERGHR